MNGFINLYKPSGVSSAGVVNAVKRKFKGFKVGHMGTLDPMASGVLPIAIGKSTRLFDYLLDKEKIYEAIFTFGYQTDTLDADGEVILNGGNIPSYNEILGVLNAQIGEIMQIPPAYSAKNVNGKRSYQLARQGVSVDLPPKKVIINDISLFKIDGDEKSFKFIISCGGGTYIRSICRDIATSLSTYATMTSLKRVKSGLFTIENSVSVQDVENCEDISNLLIKPDAVLTFEKVNLTKSLYEDVINGRKASISLKDGLYSIYAGSEFIGVASCIDNNIKIKSYIKD